MRRIAHAETINRTPTAVLERLTQLGDAASRGDPRWHRQRQPGWRRAHLHLGLRRRNARQRTSTSKVTHTYGIAGAYTATLRVRDSKGALSDPVTARAMPATRRRLRRSRRDLGPEFTVGQELTLRGSATDAEDGALADSRLTWEILRHHNEHTHPFMPATSGNGLSLTAPGPEDLPAAETSYLEVRLTATDSQGASETVIRAQPDARPPVLRKRAERARAARGRHRLHHPQDDHLVAGLRLHDRGSVPDRPLRGALRIRFVVRWRRGCAQDQDSGHRQHVRGALHGVADRALGRVLRRREVDRIGGDADQKYAEPSRMQNNSENRLVRVTADPVKLTPSKYSPKSPVCDSVKRAAYVLSVAGVSIRAQPRLHRTTNRIRRAPRRGRSGTEPRS